MAIAKLFTLKENVNNIFLGENEIPLQMYIQIKQRLAQHCKPFDIIYFFCYKLVRGFRVTCFFTGLYNTKGYDMVTYVI